MIAWLMILAFVVLAVNPLFLGGLYIKFSFLSNAYSRMHTMHTICIPHSICLLFGRTKLDNILSVSWCKINTIYKKYIRQYRLRGFIIYDLYPSQFSVIVFYADDFDDYMMLKSLRSLLFSKINYDLQLHASLISFFVCFQCGFLNILGII